MDVLTGWDMACTLWDMDGWKAIRVREELYGRIRECAVYEKRSAAAMLEVLVENALLERGYEPLSREEMTKALRASNVIRTQMLQVSSGTPAPVSDVVAGLAGLHQKIGTAGDLDDGLNSPGVTSEPVGWEP